jgi:hypothetical protein
MLFLLGKFAYNHAMKRLFLVMLFTQLACMATLLIVRGVFASVGLPLTMQMWADTRLIDQAWCWRGVCPGKTEIAVAKAQLADSDRDVLTQSEVGTAIELQWESLTNPAWYGRIDAAGITVDAMHIHLPADQMQLGDVMSQFGRPSFTFSQLSVSQKRGVRALGLATFICYEGGLCFTVEPDRCNQQMRFDAHMPVQWVFLYPVKWPRGQFGVVSEWQSMTKQYMRCPEVIY